VIYKRELLDLTLDLLYTLLLQSILFKFNRIEICVCSWPYYQRTVLSSCSLSLSAFDLHLTLELPLPPDSCRGIERNLIKKGQSSSEKSLCFTYNRSVFFGLMKSRKLKSVNCEHNRGLHKNKCRCIVQTRFHHRALRDVWSMFVIINAIWKQCSREKGSRETKPNFPSPSSHIYAIFPIKGQN
jgi:hypothetical protein